MKDYKVVLFDLDGTLTDPGEGITNSVMYALKKYGIDVEDRRTLYKFIGPPLHESFENFYDFSEEEAQRAVSYYREYYSEKGIFENVLYDGMKEVLEQLAKSGKQLMVATSKPEYFANQILEHFGIAEYFSFVAGANMDGSRTKKEDVIAYALQQCKQVDVSEILMIGDRKFDILGAKKFGIDSAGVLFGYGEKQELEDAGATYLIERPKDIAELL